MALLESYCQNKVGVSQWPHLCSLTSIVVGPPNKEGKINMEEKQPLSHQYPCSPLHLFTWPAYISNFSLWWSLAWKWSPSFLCFVLFLFFFFHVHRFLFIWGGSRTVVKIEGKAYFWLGSGLGHWIFWLVFTISSEMAGSKQLHSDLNSS